jgi:hypothetical protein
VDGRHNPVQAFAVARVGVAFSVAAVSSVTGCGHGHDGLGLAAAANGQLTLAELQKTIKNINRRPINLILGR